MRSGRSTIQQGKSGSDPFLDRGGYNCRHHWQPISTDWGTIKEDGTFDDKIVSNNGDRDTVLATIFQILNYFLTIFPDVVVLFAGSTNSRTRLYQIALNSELEKASKNFNISGFNNNLFEPFVKNKTYEAFAISKK
jgi:hypothetical protein